MKIAPRVIAALVAWTALGFAGPASAQPFPHKSQPLTIVFPFTAGGMGDILARLISPRLGESLGVPVVVENKPGANGAIGLGGVSRARPDGHTIAVVPMSTLVINPWMYKNLPYDPKELTPISQALSLPNVLVVHPSLPITSVAGLIDHAKTHPGKVSYASQGNGSSGHLMGELFNQSTKADLIHIPYKGGAQAHASLLAGEVQVMFENIGVVLPHIKAGKLRALAVSTAEPAEAMPELPPISATVPGFDAAIWFAFVGPPGMPKAVVDTLNAHLVKAMKAPDVVTAMHERGVKVLASDPAVLKNQITLDLARWGKVVKDAGIEIQ